MDGATVSGGMAAAKPHRLYTLFRNLAFAVWPAGLGLLAGRGWFVAVLTFALLVGAAVLALTFPLRQDEPIETPYKVFFGLFGGIGLLVLTAFGLVIGVICADAVTSGKVDAVFQTYPELAGQRVAGALHVDAMIPPEARDIRFEGFGGGVFAGFGRFAKFLCRTTEADFVKFAVVQGYALETNRFCNVSPNNANKIGREWAGYEWSAPAPKRYLTYENRRGNGGGITLAFDPATETLRGRFSSN